MSAFSQPKCPRWEDVLSLGEQQRLSMARCSCCRPPLCRCALRLQPSPQRQDGDGAMLLVQSVTHRRKGGVLESKKDCLSVRSDQLVVVVVNEVVAAAADERAGGAVEEAVVIDVPPGHLILKDPSNNDCSNNNDCAITTAQNRHDVSQTPGPCGFVGVFLRRDRRLAA